MLRHRFVLVVLVATTLLAPGARATSHHQISAETFAGPDFCGGPSGGVNEVQRITITGTPTGGSFTITWNGQTTADISYQAQAAAVATALEGLSNIGPGNVTAAGGPLPNTAVDFTFAGTLARAPQALATATGSPGATIAIARVTAGAGPLTVSSDDALDVVGGTARLTTSCSVVLSPGSALNFQRVELLPKAANIALFVTGSGQTALTFQDSKIEPSLQYSNKEASKTTEGNAWVDFTRTTFDGPVTRVGLCDNATVHITESHFFSREVLLRIAPCIMPTSKNSLVRVLASEFDAHGGIVGFFVGQAPDYGKLVVRDTTFAAGDRYAHKPNPSPY